MVKVRFKTCLLSLRTAEVNRELTSLLLEHQKEIQELQTAGKRFFGFEVASLLDKKRGRVHLLGKRQARPPDVDSLPVRVVRQLLQTICDYVVSTNS